MQKISTLMIPSLLLYLNLLFPYSSSAQGTANCTVNAGGDAIICGSGATLTGGVSGNTGPGGPLWSFVSGPATPTIVSPNSLTTNITGMVADGDYTFRLSHPCNSGIAASEVTITAHPKPASFTAGPDITNVCATTGSTTLAGVIPPGFTGEWRTINIYSLVRLNTQVSTNAQFSSTTTATPTFSLINKADHQIDPAYYVILRITSLDGICSYEDTAIVRFIPNPQIAAPASVSACRNPLNTRHWIDLLSTSPAFATAYAGSAGTPASGNNVSLTVLDQPPGGNLAYEEIETRRVYLSGLDVDGTYEFTLTVTNACGSYTTPPISFTYNGTTPRRVNFAMAAHPEQYMAYATAGSGGEMHCSSKIGSTVPDSFYLEIDPLDPPSVVTTVTPTGVIPPGGAPTISISGAGTYNRTVEVTPPFGGWQAGTYKFLVNTSNGTCSITQTYYIHISDNNRPDVAIADQSICYPGTGAISAAIPLPDIYKQVVNSSYFQDYNGHYNFSVVSKPSGSATPTYTPINQRSITSAQTTISNLDRAGDYVFRVTAVNSTGGVGPFLNLEYGCSGSSLTDTFIIHVENPINANAGSDQSGICDQSASLLGNPPGAGAGSWTIASAPAGAAPVILSPSNYTTTAVNLDSIGEYRFKWSITSPFGGCTSEDEVSYFVTCALPIRLINFNAVRQSSSVVLNWATASELNNKEFGIERSSDGRNWNLIGVVQSLADKGNSSSRLEYSFTDRQPLAGHNFYRLRQTDLDGRLEYSPVRMVSFNNNHPVSVYPNPARDNITIEGLADDPAIILIYDITGKLLETISPETDANEISIKEFREGMYYLVIQYPNGDSIQQKFIISR